MHRSIYSEHAFEACQDQPGTLRCHNEFLRAELYRARKEINDRDVRTIMIMGWIIAVVKLYSYL